MPKTEADLLELMRADRVAQDERLTVQTAVDLEAGAPTHRRPFKPPATNPDTERRNGSCSFPAALRGQSASGSQSKSFASIP
jgi:hypothetical protein